MCNCVLNRHKYTKIDLWANFCKSNLFKFWIMQNPEDFYKVVGSNIKRIRKKQKIKQVDFATKMEVEPSVVAKIEAGKKNITLKTLLKISEALSVLPSNLIELN
jgi:DNA-binding Xre family transcriptional regulator